MIDQIYAKRANKETRHPDGDYDPRQAILSTRLQGDGSSKLTVVFPPWHGGGKYIDRLTGRLVSTGSDVLDFDFHDNILEPDLQRVVQSYEHVRDTATSKIEQLIKQRGYEKVRLIGLSLGNAAMALVASRLNDFDSATIVTGASTLALPVWEGTSSQHIVEDFKEQGITKHQLEAYWEDLAPITYAQAFKDKEVQMYVATRDKIIPTAYQQELFRGLNKVGARTNATHLPMGHYATTGFFYYRGK